MKRVLPKSAKWIVECIGEEKAWALCDRLGGTPLWLPNDPSPTSQLSLAIGIVAARKLCQCYPDQPVQIPSRRACESAQLAHDVVIAVQEDGMSVTTAARTFGLSSRQIYRILNKHGRFN